MANTAIGTDYYIIANCDTTQKYTPCTYVYIVTYINIAFNAMSPTTFIF